MATNPELTVTDEELNSLLDDLEAISADISAAAPVATPAAIPEPEPIDEDLAGLEELPLEEAAAVAEPAALPVSEEQSLDDQLAELEALAAQPEPAVVSELPFVPDEKPTTVFNPKTGKAHSVKEDKPTPVAAAVKEAVKVITAIAAVTEIDEEATKASPLNYVVDAHAFRGETAINDTNLDDAMIKQASLRAYYNTLAAQAEAQANRMKARFDVIEAKLNHDHRRILVEEESAGGAKATEKSVDNAVKLDPRWLKAKNTLIEAEAIASINKGLAISLADRRDMLIQLGSDRREEGKGQVRILAAQQDRDDLVKRAKSAAMQ